MNTKKNDVSADKSGEQPSKAVPTHVVGIGASAGGLEALQALFAQMPVDLGIAYVVIQHLSPDFKSMMAELLSKNTKMPTHQAIEGEELVPNAVYLIPSGKLIRIVENRIYLSDLPPDNRINLPINEFFRSLAEDQQNRGIGIILSGTGSDGSRGILALKEVGALVLAQDPEEAQFDGMPNNAINTGAVDFTLSVQDMPEQIRKFVLHPLVSYKRDSFKSHLAENTELLEKILSLVLKHTDLDFKAYKESTVSRRIEHRMGINNKKTLEEYWSYLKENKDEISFIKQDLLIGVTQFFRDTEVWEGIKEQVVLPILRKKREDNVIRIWCTGCSTGEEAYTIAMLFQEGIERLKLDRELKVFASDVDQAAIAFGANGCYPASIASEVPSTLLSRYFVQRSDGSYQVTKLLRSKVVFATHNLIQDPPFSNMDFISCRNTLIYLQNAAQQKAFAFFHFALKLGGYLLLGSAESLGSFNNYFETIESRNKIYRKDRDIRIPVTSMAEAKILHKNYQPKSLPQFLSRDLARKERIKRYQPIGQEVLFNHYVPPTLVFDNKLSLVYSYGDTSLFTRKIQPGFVSNSLTDILVSELVGLALTAANQVLRDHQSVMFNNVFSTGENEAVSWSLKCFEATDEGALESNVMISFIREEGASSQRADHKYNIDEQASQRIEELDQSLVEYQELYRQTLEELDTTSEELQSSNEELMAANEELQSTNEELQSVNEELYTVNSEHQQKIAELTESNNDFENLLKTSRLAVLFLDEELKIRRFTHALKAFFNIIDFDIDRDFRDITAKYTFENLDNMVLSVNENAEPTLTVFEIDEETKIEVSITPYVARELNRGVVLSMRKLEL